MKYKEFYKWCSDRTFDGCWGMYEAIICINIIEDFKKTPFWKRKKKWEEMKEEIVTNIVEPINKKIAEVQQMSAS